MELEKLIEIVKQPEGEELEFKTRLPNIRQIAIIFSAFANTKGGKLIVGVREDSSIVGVKNIEHAQQIIKNALETISPRLQVDIEIVTIDGKSVLVILVSKGTAPPYFVAGRAFQRYNTQTIPITSKTLFANIREHTITLDELTAEVKYLSEIIEKRNYDLIKARSWKTKIPDMIIGGVIGAIISLALGLLIRGF